MAEHDNDIGKQVKWDGLGGQCEQGSNFSLQFWPMAVAGVWLRTYLDSVRARLATPVSLWTVDPTHPPEPSAVARFPIKPRHLGQPGTTSCEVPASV